MLTLEQARARIKIEQEKMYHLTECPLPGLQIQMSAITINHIYNAVSDEDRMILIQEHLKRTMGE